MIDEPRYIFGDLLSGSIIEEIPCQGVSLSLALDGGEWRGSLGLDLTGKSNEDLVNATIPGKAYVVCEAGDGSRVFWGGIVWTATYQSQAKVYELYAKTLDQYPSKRIIEQSTTWVNQDARAIMVDLWSMMMAAEPNTPAVILPDRNSFSGLEIESFSVNAADMATYRTAMDTVSNTETGFEWTIDWTRAGSGYTRTLRIGTPLGQPAGSYDVVFEYPGAILNYWRNDAISSSGTHIYGVGAGEGSSMPIVEVLHSDLILGGFPRYDQSFSFKDISDPNQLEQLVRKQAQLFKAPQPVYTVELKADREPMFGDYYIGDACRLVIVDPRHPNGLNFPTRIVKWEYYPKQGGQTAEVRLTFEGDDGS